MPLNEDAKWEVYCTWIAENDFDDGERPNAEQLAELLQSLGVTLETLEAHIGKNAGL
jgi:hypothetical protein